MEQKVAIGFAPNDMQSFSAELEREFPELTPIRSSGFSGTEIISIVVPSSVLLISKILDFYSRKRDTLKKTTFKIDKDSIDLSGHTETEIQKLIRSGSIEDLIKQLKGDQ